MRSRKCAVLVLAAAVGLSGCATLRENTTACRVATTLTGATLGAVGGGVGTKNIEKDPDNGEVAAGAAAGLVGGTLIGALLGYAVCPEEAKPAPPPPPPPPPPPAPRKVETLTGPNFDFDKYVLRPTGHEKIRRAAASLKGTNERITCVGYTDSIGSDAYNLRLSERRAQTVKEALIKEGIPASRITTKGMGKSNPVASNSTAAGRAENRRVEIIAE